MFSKRHQCKQQAQAVEEDVNAGPTDRKEIRIMKQFDIEASPKARGKAELLKHMAGKRLTQRGQIIAKCYECMCGYADGKRSCKMPDCPLYPSMPYREVD